MSILGTAISRDWKESYLLGLQLFLQRYLSPTAHVVHFNLASSSLCYLYIPDHSDTFTNAILNYEWRSIDVIEDKNEFYICTEHVIQDYQNSLQFNLYETNGDILFSFHTLSNKSNVGIMNFWKEWMALLYSNPRTPIGDLHLKNSSTLTGESLDFPKESIYSIFNRNVNEYPNNPILYEYVHENGGSITYSEFNERVDMVFYNLKMKWNNGAKGENICVHLDRSIDLLSCIFAILRLGATYIPLDISWPESRISKIIEDSKPSCIISNTLNFNNVIRFTHFTCDNIVSTNERFDSLDSIPYILYTSGSTGAPKGVIGNQSALLNRCNWMWTKYPFQENEKMIMKTSIGFVDSLWEIFGSLLSATPLFVASHDVGKDVFRLIDCIKKDKITRFVGVPSLFKASLSVPNINDKLKSLTIVVSSGEALSKELAKSLMNVLNEQCILLNLYGSTEVTADATFFEITGESLDKLSSVPIGIPISNCSIFLYDDNLNPVQEGIIGNIYVGGSCLCNGYNNKELSEKVFINCKYTGERIYSTGDLGYVLDNVLMYKGRKDKQVKVRGHRIELSDIEYQLESIEEISTSVVLFLEKSGQLIAFIVSTLSCKNIRSKLQELVPDYMLPHRFIKVESIPLTPNGKIDSMKLLTLIDTKDSINEDGTVEAIVTKIFYDIIGFDIDLNLNFMEVGGDSLTAIRIIGRIYNEFNCQISTKQIFSFHNLKELVSLITTFKSEIELPKLCISNSSENILSHSQKGIWFVQQLHPELDAFIIPIGFKFNGKVNIDKLKSVLKFLMKHHSVLCSFYSIDSLGEPHVRYVNNLGVDDVLQVIPNPENITNCIDEFMNKKLDIFMENTIPWRALCITNEYNVNYFIVQFHHIICDGWSIEVFLKDFSYYYNNTIEDSQQIHFKNLQYKDYTSWQKELLSTPIIKEKLTNFWKEQLIDIEDTCGSISGDLSTTCLKNPNPLIIDIPNDIVSSLQKISIQTQSTIYTWLTSSLILMLYRCSSNLDVTITTPVAMRNQLELQNIFGMFVNTIPIRTKLKSDMTIREFVELVKQSILQSLDHSEMPFDMLVQQSEISRSVNQIAFSQVMIVQEEISPEKILNLGENIEIESLELYEKSPSCDFTLFTRINCDGIRLRFRLSSKYSEEYQSKLAKLYLHILLEMTKENNLNTELISTISILSDEEKQRTISQWNEPVEYFPNIHLFEEISNRAKERPDSFCIKNGNETLTYSQLISSSTKISTWIQNYTLNLDVLEEVPIIGLYCNRGCNSIIGILGIIAAGFAYTPLDPEFPLSKLQSIINESKMKFIIYDLEPNNEHEFSIPSYSISNILSLELNTSCNMKIVKNEVCTVLFTSGTTDKPKGVMLTHENLMALVSNANWISIKSNDVISQVNTLTFDLSVSEIFSALLNGACLEIIEKKTLLDPVQFEKYIEQKHVTISILPTSVFHIIAKYHPRAFGCLSYVVIAGEKANTKYCNEVLKSITPPKHLLNLYGPTEITYACTYYEVNSIFPEDKDIPIGRPMSNSQVYVVDENLQIVPENVTGEIVVGGSKVAKGYLVAAKSADKFVKDPFYKGAGNMIYKTGDYGRYGEDGLIYFVARMDQQVKIRGFRVEPQEVSQCMESFSKVNSAITIACSNNGEKYLIGYYIGTCNTKEIREYIISQLPDYMVPRFLIQMEDFPLTDRGKIDKLKLPLPTIQDLESNTWSESEKQLGTLFKNLLFINVDDKKVSFFQIGGNSLLAMRLLAQIKSKMNADISIKDIFNYPTIEGLALIIDRKVHSSTESIISCEIDSKPFSLSRGQLRMWIDQYLSPQSPHYNVPFTIRLKGPLNTNLLRKSIMNLINRIPSLRIHIVSSNDSNEEPKQKYLSSKQILLDFPVCRCNSSNIAELVQNQHMQIFDLNTSQLLLKPCLFQIDTDDSVLAITFHHLICDGYSLNIFRNELFNEYSKLLRNELSINNIQYHYKDFILFEDKISQTETVSQHKDFIFWKEYLSSFKEVQLPFKTSSIIQTKDPLAMKSVERTISSCDFEKFESFCKNMNYTNYMGLLSIFYIILFRYSSQQDLYIGSIISNRPRTEFENIIGFFVNNNFSCATISNDTTFQSMISSINDFILKAWDHSTLDLNTIVHEFAKQSNISANNLLQELLSIVFVLQDNIPPPSEIQGTNGLKCETLFVDLPFTKFDLILECIPLYTGELRCIISYNTQIYPNCNFLIEQLLNHFIQLIHLIPKQQNSFTPISKLQFLSEEERKFLIKIPKISYNPTVHTVPIIYNSLSHILSDNIAIRSLEGVLSWKQVNTYFKRISAKLIQLGISIGDTIVFCMDRGISQYLSILSSILIGAAFTCVTSDLPIERISTIVKTCKASLLITDSNNYELVSNIDIPTFCISSYQKLLFENEILDESIISKRQSMIKGEDTCYIIFTSGTTGVPKGIEISHSNVVSRFYTHANCTFVQGMTMLQATSPLFDPFMNDLFSSLFLNCTLVLVPFSIINTSRVLELIKQFKIEVTTLSTSCFNLYCQQQKEIFDELKIVIFGGSIPPRSTVETILDMNTKCTFYNYYGPSEGTYSFSGCRVERKSYNNGNLSIGRPLHPGYFYIVDSNMNLLPRGIPGELIIGGPGISTKGYIGYKSSKFIPDPFSNETKPPIVYLTGDIVFIGEDNTLYIKGRKDDQVKIQGYRVELSEISIVTQKHPKVDNVYLKKDNLLDELVLVYCGTISPQVLNSFLDNYLPKYMIPKLILYPHPVFPLQANSKIDSKLLDEFIQNNSLQNEPILKEEIQCNFENENINDSLEILWNRVLGFNIEDKQISFFQAGGSSLRLIQLLKLLQSKYPSLPIKMSDLLIHNSFNAQLKYLSELQSKDNTVKRIPSVLPKSTNNKESVSSNDIAIIGMDCFVPGAKDIDSFWNNLQNGVDSITREDAKYPTVIAGGILEDVELFDFKYFKLTKKEACLIEPQHRWLLESCSNSLQYAGLDPMNYQSITHDKQIGIFSSIGSNSYSKIHTNTSSSSNTAQDFQSDVAGLLDTASTRVAYSLGLTGPAMAIQTACSSSLVAVHMACQSINNGDCSAALVGGSSITFPQLEGFEYQEGMILSPEGKCKSFDYKADGIVSGNGIGSILLMSKDEAEKNGFPILALIKGSAINNDGNNKASYHSGNIIQHTQVIKKALYRSGLKSVDYVEAHGAGTALGDLIEVSAFVEAYGKDCELILGSVKSNIGHTGPSAGIIGLIKTVLSIQNNLIPKTLHFTKLHPNIQQLSNKLIVPHENYYWNSSVDCLRSAAIHSFGQGGTNAHVILQEYKSNRNVIEEINDLESELLVFSATSESSLINMLNIYCNWFKQNQELNLKDISSTLQIGRKECNYRKYFTVHSIDDAITKIKMDSKCSQISNNSYQFVFMFPGQGTEFNEMAKDLYFKFPEFTNAVDECNKILKEYNIDILSIIFHDGFMEDMERTLYSQLSIFIISYGLAKLLISCGIEPSILIGHSFGEYVAACISNVISLKDAIYLLHHRGKLLASTIKGRMIAVRCEKTNEILMKAKDFNVDLAAYNDKTQLIFSGKIQDIEEWEKFLINELELKVTVLKVENGFHSRCVDEILPLFRKIVEKVTFNIPKYNFISSVTGTWITNQEVTSIDYWVNHLRKPVLFYNSIEACKNYFLNSNTIPIFLQVGPGKWMQSVVMKDIVAILDSKNTSNIPSISELTPKIIIPNQSSVDNYFNFIGSLWCFGKKIYWNGLQPNTISRCRLPLYPYERVLCSKFNDNVLSHSISKNIESTSFGTVTRNEFVNLQNEVLMLKSMLAKTNENMELIMNGKGKSKISNYSSKVKELICPLYNQTKHDRWKLSISLSKGEEIEYYHFNNRCRPISIKNNNLFPIGCLSSCFVLSLFEEMIHQQKVTRYTILGELLPSDWQLPETILSIQLHHLASHTSGLACIPSGFIWNSPSDDPNSLKNFTITSLIHELQTCSLLFPPGTKSFYSPLGISLLGLVLTIKQNSSSEDYAASFESIMASMILHPNELYSTTIIPNSSIELGYYVDGTLKESWNCGPIFSIGDGFYSNMEELSVFISSMKQEKNFGNYLMKSESDYFWTVGLTPDSSCWIGYSKKYDCSVTIHLNTAMDISLELTKLGERCLNLLSGNSTSIKDSCTFITDDVLRIWKGLSGSPMIMNHLSNSSISKNISKSIIQENLNINFSSILEEIIGNLLFGNEQQFELDHNSSFNDLGIDSLQILVLAGEIQKHLPANIKLQAMDLFEYPSINSLGNHLSKALDIKDSKCNEFMKPNLSKPKICNTEKILEIEDSLLQHQCNPIYSHFTSYSLKKYDNILPLILIPKSSKTFSEHLEILEKEREKIRNHIKDYGAVLLRDFPIHTANEFSSILDCIFPGTESRGYKDGISPRTSVLADEVFTSTEYPSHLNMDLHNEMSYSPSPPEFILFFCHTAPDKDKGGKTPIASSRLIYYKIDKEIRNLFEQKGIQYVTNLPSKYGGHHFGLSWQQTYSTDNPCDVEEFCTKHGIKYQWVDPNSGELLDKSAITSNKNITLRTIRICPAVRRDENGIKYWFNHSHLFHPSDLTLSAREGLQKLIPEELFPKNCYFGDGTSIPEEFLSHIRNTMRSCEHGFHWKTGDILLINNLTICHGRHSFTGPRKILVSMK